MAHFQQGIPELPQRGGIKDYAPDGSWIQGKKLDAFQDERHRVLSEERIKPLLVFSTDILHHVQK